MKTAIVAWAVAVALAAAGLTWAQEGPGADLPPPHPGHRPDPEIGAMLDSMTDAERTAAFAKMRAEWIATLSPERKAALEERVAEMKKVRAMSHAERKAFFDGKRDAWLASLSPEQKAAHDARKAELDTVRKLTQEEQRAYFEKRRAEFEAMSPEEQAAEKALRPPGPFGRRR